jgi:hypothetical protein
LNFDLKMKQGSFGIGKKKEKRENWLIHNELTKESLTGRREGDEERSGKHGGRRDGGMADRIAGSVTGSAGRSYASRAQAVAVTATTAAAAKMDNKHIKVCQHMISKGQGAKPRGGYTSGFGL